MPVAGYEKMPLVSLEIAVEPLIDLLPTIQSYAYVAKQRCNEPADGLTSDESASIMLYTMGWEPLNECLYVALNSALRSEDRVNLKRWFSYLKLFVTALLRLPSQQLIVYRGIKLDVSHGYQPENTVVWWGFSSCSTSLGILESEHFLGVTGTRTIFVIQCDTGRDICKHSYFQTENEVLLLAATKFKVISCLQQGHGLKIIQLKEIQPTHPHLQLPLNSDTYSLPQFVARTTRDSTVYPTKNPPSVYD
jgi:hypothetical protein